MIDVESRIYTAVKDALPSGVSMSGEFELQPASFPHVCFQEGNNSHYKPSMTKQENHASVMYEVNIYSNKQVGKKAEAKAIRDAIDSVMTGFGFERVMSEPISNLHDSTLYRIVSRYEAAVGKDHTIYRR